jgi:hypothetical protein
VPLIEISKSKGSPETIANQTSRNRAVATWSTISIFLIILWGLNWYFRLGYGLIRFLPVVVLISLTVLLAKLIPGRDIETEADVIPNWNAGKITDSIAEIHSYVIKEAGKSIQWYWRAKRSKAVPSQLIRFSAWALAAVAGILPVVGSLFKNSLPVNTDLANGLWASLLLGIAAALVGLDKAFGYSSGWARYVLTATNIHKTLEEFRMEWADLLAKAGSTPTPESIAQLIDRARKFRTDVDGLVLQETKDWVTEFQSSMSQMEKDVVAQIAALKSQVDKAAQIKEAAEQPGSIQLQIQNASKVDGGTAISVCLSDAQGKTIQETASGRSWARLNLLPGQYKIRIQASVGGQSVEDQKVVLIKPGEVAEVQLAL